jgi:hypothetical protein
MENLQGNLEKQVNLLSEESHPFKKATVFVFSKKGELLLGKDFPVL